MSTNKPKPKPTQHLIDNIFSCLSGYGRLTYQLDECRYIQNVIKEEYDIFISINECQTFWVWRSNLWDSSFLSLTKSDNSRKEIKEYFLKWLDELDMWDWAEIEK